MLLTVSILASATIAGLMLWLGWRIDPASDEGAQICERIEPGWTETIYTDGRLVGARAYEAHDPRMELEIRARVGVHPC